MNSSYYNIPVELGSEILLFNSISKSFVIFYKDRFKEIYRKGEFITERLSPKESSDLYKNGFLSENDNETERNLWLAIRNKRRLNTKSYLMIVNPTLDCNLRCWYCYENHKKGSRFTATLIDAILENLEMQFKINSFSDFTLSLFGGEPLLATNEVISLIDRVSEFCNNKNIKLHLFFTTNGTLVNSRLIHAIHDFECSFQVTLDGDQKIHDTIRVFKANPGLGTSQIIYKNIKRLLVELPLSKVIVRLNYTGRTLNNMGGIYNFLGELDANKVRVSLHKVWQENEGEVSTELLINHVLKIRKMGFEINVQSLPTEDSLCYADYLNCVVVNYNGDVFKCTAKDFTSQNKCGYLDNSGIICWDQEELGKHVFSSIPNNCQKCKYLPCCPSFCSQGCIDNNHGICILPSGITLEDIVLYNYLIRRENHEKNSL